MKNPESPGKATGVFFQLRCGFKRNQNQKIRTLRPDILLLRQVCPRAKFQDKASLGHPYQTRRGFDAGVSKYGVYFPLYVAATTTTTTDDGYAGVPPTAIAKVKAESFHINDTSGSGGSGNGSKINYKIGSIQSYCNHVCSCEDLGSSRFDRDDIMKIAILDIRVCNLDRHLGECGVVWCSVDEFELQGCRGVRESLYTFLTTSNEENQNSQT